MRAQRGWTLVELAVTMVILAVLSAAIATSYQSFMNNKNDSAVRTLLDRVVLMEQQASTTWDHYTPYAVDLNNVGSDLTIVENAGPALDATQVSVIVGENGTLGLAARSQTGTCFLVSVTNALDEGGPQRTDSSPVLDVCTATAALPAGEGVGPYVAGGTVKTF